MKIMPTSTFWPGIVINKSSWLNVVSLPNFFLLDTMTNKDDWLYEENIEKILSWLASDPLLQWKEQLHFIISKSTKIEYSK